MPERNVVQTRLRMLLRAQKRIEQLEKENEELRELLFLLQRLLWAGPSDAEAINAVSKLLQEALRPPPG